MPSRLGNLLAMKTTSAGKGHLLPGLRRRRSRRYGPQVQQLLTEEEYRAAREQYGEGVRSRHGCRSDSQAAYRLDLVQAVQGSAQRNLDETGQAERRKTSSTDLKIVESIRDSDNKPEWMVMDVIPGHSARLATVGVARLGNFATSDLNDLYRRIINRNNRLQEAGRPQRAGSHHSQRKANVAAIGRRVVRQQSLQASCAGFSSNRPAQVADRHDQR